MSDNKERNNNRDNTSTDSVNDSYAHVSMTRSQSTAPRPLSAQALLERARGHMDDRASTYDTQRGERSVKRATDAFNSITGHSLKESEGWLLLQLVKDVRQWSRPEYHEDSAEDCIAYAALKAEALVRGD